MDVKENKELEEMTIHILNNKISSLASLVQKMSQKIQQLESKIDDLESQIDNVEGIAQEARNR
jgi:prefoldin subunit 5